MEEVWKDIQGCKGYQISNFGRVKSVFRKVNNKNGSRSVRERILKTYSKNNGYEEISLNNKRFRVHRLVAESFIPNPENKRFIDHINTIKTDNRVENLRWVTQSENNNNQLTIEKIRKAMTGLRCHEETKKAKSEKAIKQPIKCVETGVIYNSIKECWRITGLDRGHISQVCRGLRKSCGGFHWEYYND